MAYIFDPLRNTFIDDEDTSLGNKLAFLDEDLEKAIREIGEKYGPDTIKTLDQLPENKPAEVEDTEAFNRFNKLYQDGGRVNQQAGTNVMTLNPLFPEKSTNFMSEEFKPIDVPGGFILPASVGLGAKRFSDIFFSKEEGDDKNETKKSDNKLPNIEPPRIPDPLEIAENVLTLKEIRDTFEKSKQLYDQKKMSEVVKVTNKEFAQKLANFIDTNYDGRVETAVKDIIGVKEKTKDVENLRRRINDLFKNRGIKRGERTGNIAPSLLNFETDTPKTSWSDFTTKVSTDSSYIKNLTKPLIKKGLLNKSLYLAQRDLEKVFNIELPDTKAGKSARNDMAMQIKKLSDEGGVRKKQKGKFPYYHLGDVMKAFQLKYGEGGKKITGVITTGTPKKYKQLKSFDEGLHSIITSFQDAFGGAAKIENLTTDKNKVIDKATPDHSHAEPRSTMLKFPNVFKNSNIKTFQTITLTDPIFNQEILSKGGFEAKKIKIYRTLNNYIGKKVTPEIQEILTEQKLKLNNINNEIIVAANKAGLEGVEETFVPIDINVPNVGEKFRSENIFGDTTGKNIMGNVDEINPNAKVYNDLSKEEKALYKDNLVSEYIDYYKDFYERLDFDADDIASFIDRVLEGDPAGQTLPISERQIEKAKGGGVEISPMPRAEFGNGGAAGADNDFAAQLEYFFLNPDAELPAAQTFRETKNPISIVNDMIDPRNIPYYADRLVESGIRIGEFGARVLPAVGKLAADLIQKPAFKIKPAEGQGYVQDYADIPPSNITGTGIFSEFLNNLVGSEGTKAITEKTGLAKLIKDEEQKMKDERKTAGAKILADQVTLGMELTAPIFPGLKLLKAYAKNRNLPVDKTTREIMDKEIDEVLTKQGISRRDFMKVAGAGGAVAIAKLLGFGDDMIKTAKVTRAAPIMDNTVQGMPAWFKDAVFAIERKGLLKSRGDIKGIEPDFFEITLDTKLGKKTVLMSKNDRTGEITLDWTTNYYDMAVPVTITFKPGQSGKQNFLSDPEFPQSVEKYDVEVEAPEFEYKSADVESMGPDDVNFDSSVNLDIKEEADAVVEALEELGLGLTKTQKKDAADNFRYYNEVELDESASGPDTANPIDENDAFPFLDEVKRNK